MRDGLSVKEMMPQVKGLSDPLIRYYAAVGYRSQEVTAREPWAYVRIVPDRIVSGMTAVDEGVAVGSFKLPRAALELYLTIPNWARRLGGFWLEPCQNPPNRPVGGSRSSFLTSTCTGEAGTIQSGLRPDLGNI